MEEINNLISKSPIQLTTNTIILIVVAIVALYVLIKAMGNLIKIAAMIDVCYFVLMSLQSTNLVNIPVIKETYIAIEKIIPSKELWIETIDKVDKINKAVDQLK